MRLVQALWPVWFVVGAVSGPALIAFALLGVWLFRGDGTHDRVVVRRLKRALEEYVVEGMKTTIPLHQKLVRDPEFLAGNYTIKWLEQWLAKNAG